MKKFAAILLSLLLVLSFSSCTLQYNADIHWNIFGAGEVTITMVMDSELYEAYKQQNNKTLETIVVNGVTMYGESKTIKFLNLKQLKTMLTYADGQTETIMGETLDDPFFTSVEASPFSFDGTTNADVLGFEGYDLSSVGITETITITFPTKVKDTNGLLSDNGKTVSWAVNGQSTQLYAKCSNPWIWLWIVPACLISVVIILIVSVTKQKKKMALGTAEIKEEEETHEENK